MKGYKLYNIENKRFFVSRDVVFHENVFPFHSITLQGDIADPFPDIVLPIPPNFSGISDDLGAPQPPESNEVLPSLPNSTSGSDVNPTFFSTDVDSSTRDTVVAVQPTTVTSDARPSANAAIDPSIQSSAVIAPRRFSRVVKQPSYLQDYYCALLQAGPLPATNTKFPLHKVLSHDKLSTGFRNFALTVPSVYEPQFYYQAVPFLHWWEAMNAELQAMEANNTWTVMTLPVGHHSVGCKWIYKVKYKTDGTVERYKARLVAKGYTQ